MHIQDIDCIVHDDLTTEVIPPPNFNPDLPTKIVTHGFSSRKIYIIVLIMNIVYD